MRKYKFLTEKIYTLTIVYIFFTVYNVATWDSRAGLILSLLQYFFVGICIIRDVRLAFFLHLIFTVSCVNGGLVTIEHSYSYAKLKLVGPFTLNYIVLGIIWLINFNKRIKVDQSSLILSFRKLVIMFMVVGSVIGFLGIATDNNYKIRYFIDHLLYVVIAFIYVDTFAKIYNEQLSKVLAISVICMISASAISAVFSFIVLGVKANYSVDESFISNPIYNLSPCLFIGLFQLNDFKLKIVSIAGIISFIMSTTLMSRGATFVNSFVAILLFFYWIYFKRTPGRQIVRLRLVLPWLIIPVVLFLLNIVLSSGNTVSNIKFEQFLSLFSLFDFSEGLNERLAMVGRSPYIRIAQIFDVINDGLNNVVTLFIGSGYGSYYTDSLNLFSGVDLTVGAFPYEMIRTGHFYKAHHMIPCTILFNGLIGLFFIIKLGLSYLRHIDKTFLVYAGFSLFLYGFYFDIVALVSCSMALFGAEYMISSKGIENSICEG